MKDVEGKEGGGKVESISKDVLRDTILRKKIGKYGKDIFEVKERI